jgi:hypothetical protein
MDMRLEPYRSPVSDVDRAKAFSTAGQLPPTTTIRSPTSFGSCSSAARFRLFDSIGMGLSQMPPGSVQGLQLVVSDIEAARRARGRGVEVRATSRTSLGLFVFFAPRRQPLAVADPSRARVAARDHGAEMPTDVRASGWGSAWGSASVTASRPVALLDGSLVGTGRFCVRHAGS